MFSLSSLPASSRWLDAASDRLDGASQRWSTQRRINSARDDAAGLAISERFLAQIRGEQVAQRGAAGGLSLAETADGALGQVSENLQRMRELALQSRNGSLGDSDRAHLDAEYHQLGLEVGRVVGATSFNGQKILAGDAGARDINTGPGAHDTLTLTTPDLRSDTDLSAATGGSIASAGSSGAMVDAIDKALASIEGQRATLGASQNRLQAVADTAALHQETASRVYDRLTSADPAATASQWRLAQVQQYATVSMFRLDASSTRQLLSLFG